MKYLSVLFACMVMALSTMPCFLMDKCLFSEDVTSCGCETGDDDGCPADCCSPFMHCSTCPGCTQPETVMIGTPVVRTFRNIQFAHAEGTISSFSHSIWQPPKA